MLSWSLYFVAATYAVPGSCGETSMEWTIVHSGRSGGVTFCQLPPLSRDTWTRPSSEPAQSTPRSCGDSAKA